MIWLCFVLWQFELSLTSPDSDEHNLCGLPEVDNPKWRVNQFANMIQTEFWNDSASIGVGLKHSTMHQDSSHEIITDMWHILLSVILLNSL